MNKKLLLCLIASTILASCNKNNSNQPSDSIDINNSSNSSSEDTIIKDYYAVINSVYDVVYIYGVQGESFDLSTIDTSRCFSGKPTYKINNDGVSISGDTLTFNKVGTYTIEANANGIKQFAIQVSVGENEASRYLYPKSINLENYTQRSGNSDLVTIENDTITMQATGSIWNRITYALDENYSKNYTLECDATFLNTTDSSRWLGIVFRNQESDNKTYPYYQFDIRQNTASSNAVEVTYVYNSTSYSYPYIGTWNNGNPGVLSSNDTVHMKLKVQNSNFTGTLSCNDYTTTFDTTLPNASTGEFGFQCAGSTVKFENIKISLDEETKIMSYANTSDSIVNIEDDAIDGMKPNMIASGSTIDELYGVNEYCQQFFVRAESLKVYNINDALMDVTLNELFLDLRGQYIPNIQIEDEKTLQYVTEICNSYGIIDLVIWSSKGEILDAARKQMSYARLGYIPENVTSFESYDEIAEICHEAGRHYANLILIDSELLNKENIVKVTGLGYSIVANAKNGDNYSVISGALSGCKLILANYNSNVQKQTNLIYNDSIFNVNESSTSLDKQVHSLFSIPYVTGHRGAGTNGSNPAVTLPENTIESFKWAYDNGAQAIEIDIHETSDNRLAVIHDETTGAFSNVNLNIKRSTLAELQAIPLKCGNIYSYDYHIPSLEEVFDTFSTDEYNNKTIVIEVKDNLTKTGKMAIEMAKQKGWYNRITLITFSAATAKELREYDPAIQVGYLNTVIRHTNEEYWSSVNSFLSSGVGLASQLTTISTEPLQESNARGQMYWLWTFGYENSSQLANHIFDGNRAYTTNYVPCFTNNKYKLIYDNDITLAINETKQLTAKSVTYSQTETTEKDIEIIVLTDNATANNNNITRTGQGDIYAVIKYKTEWELYNTTTNFYIYSDIVVIK